MTRAEFVKIVETLIQDRTSHIATYDPGIRGLSSANYISELIDSHVGELSDYAPQKFIEDILGTNTRYYALDALTHWPAAPNDNNAEVATIWFPWPATQEATTNRDNYEYDKENWDVDHWPIAGAQKKALIFKGGDVPGVSETIRILYYIDQEMVSSPITLDAKHINAFASLIAGNYILGGIASNSMQYVRGTPVADAINPPNPVRTAQDAGQKLIDMFYFHFGDDPLKPGKTKLRQWNKATDKTSRHWLGYRGK